MMLGLTMFGIGMLGMSVTESQRWLALYSVLMLAGVMVLAVSPALI